MDVISGEIGGELRLAILRQNGKQTPMTGGSISGSQMYTLYFYYS